MMAAVKKVLAFKELKFVSFSDDIKFCGDYLVNRKSLLNLKFVKFTFLVMNIKK